MKPKSHRVPIIAALLCVGVAYAAIARAKGGSKLIDVVERLEIHQSGVSRHLRILLDAGFVQMRPDGQRRLYSLRPEPFRELDTWVAEYRSLWEARLDRFGEAVEKRRRAAKPKEKKR